MNTLNLVLLVVCFGPPLLIVGSCALDCLKREIQLRRGEL